MKYKNIKLVFLALTGLSLCSCLDLQPQDQLGGNKMWTSVSDYKNFANNFYKWTTDFSSIYNDGSPHSDSRSDILTYSSINIYSKERIQYRLQMEIIQRIITISDGQIFYCRIQKVIHVPLILNNIWAKLISFGHILTLTCWNFMGMPLS